MAEFKLIPPHLYQGNQVIINSDRLLFNAKVDTILMFSPNAIGLSSAGTLNFDSDKECTINSPKIYLGIKSDGSPANEPLLLGNKTGIWLKELLTALQFLSDKLAINGEYIGSTEYASLSVSTPAQNLSEAINSLISTLESIKSKQNFTI
jgi:hypothetical protein